MFSKKQLVRCKTCGIIKESNPNPDDVCQRCNKKMPAFEGGMTSDEYNAIDEYLNKTKIGIYLYTGNFAPSYLRKQNVKILKFFPNNGNSCEALIQLYNGSGGQCDWIPRTEILNNLQNPNLDYGTLHDAILRDPRF